LHTLRALMSEKSSGTLANEIRQYASFGKKSDLSFKHVVCSAGMPGKNNSKSQLTLVRAGMRWKQEAFTVGTSTSRECYAKQLLLT